MGLQETPDHSSQQLVPGSHVDSMPDGSDFMPDLNASNPVLSSTWHARDGSISSSSSRKKKQQRLALEGIVQFCCNIYVVLFRN